MVNFSHPFPHTWFLKPPLDMKWIFLGFQSNGSFKSHLWGRENGCKDLKTNVVLYNIVIHLSLKKAVTRKMKPLIWSPSEIKNPIFFYCLIYFGGYPNVNEWVSPINESGLLVKQWWWSLQWYHAMPFPQQDAVKIKHL